MTVTPGGRVLVDVYVNGGVRMAARRLRALGMDVTAVSRRVPERIVEGYLPLDAATKVAGLHATKAVLPVTGVGVDTGAVLSQGDAAHHGPQARALGPTGAGVTVGVMSDSIGQVAGGAALATSKSNGDLPSGVTILNDAPGGSDEGRAMAEVIYDEAPGVTNMVFDTGTTGAATKAAHIADLVSNGAKIIADDTSYLSEPFFQDGVVAQAVDQAVASGTAYLAAAGTHARQSWEGTFTPGAGGNNDFGAGDIQQSIITVPAGATLTGELQWDEPWGHATTDFDANVFVNGVLFAAGSGQTDNIASGIPAVSFGVTAGGSAVQVSLEINRFAGTGAPRLKYILAGNFGSFTVAEHATNSSAINPDAAAANGALAVAAVCWSTLAASCPNGAGLQAPEGFSSRGPVIRTRDAAGNALSTPEVRQKPNVAGADGVATDFPAGSGFNPFFGTSAAVASVAGIATLARSAKPSLTISQLYAILTDPAAALDSTSAPGVPDTDCGAGFSQADKVVAEALDTTPPVIAPALTPATPDGAHGWYHVPVLVSWNAADPQSVLTAETGCGPTTVSTDAVTTLTCQATSIGGPGTGTVTVKRDTSPPTPPVFTGISAKAYSPSKLPKRSAVHCSASDATSGVDSCVITGYATTIGLHALRATATDDAGLTSASTLTYAAGTISKLKITKVKLAKLLKSGLRLSVSVFRGGTKLTIKLSASASAAKPVSAGRLKKTTGAGTAKLRVKISKTDDTALAKVRKATITVTVTGTVDGATTKLRGKAKLKR